MLPNDKDKLLAPSKYEDFAEAFADVFLSPSLRTAMIFSLRNPETTKKLLGQAGASIPAPPDPNWQRDVADALEKTDRQRLVELVKAGCHESPPTRKSAEFIFKFDFGGLVRGAVEKMARQFPAKRGAKAKATRRDYPIIARIADGLRPVCLRIVGEMRSQTRDTVRQLLQRFNPEFPEACEFLLAHISQFESVLRNQGLRTRAKGVESFARLVADGVAGADYELEPRTSIERAREGRRMLARLHK